MFFFKTIIYWLIIAICSLITNSMNMKVLYLCLPVAKCLFESLSVITVPLTLLTGNG